MSSNLSRLTVHISSCLYYKMYFIAGYNARSANREIELLIRRRVESFEKEHGKINIDEK